MNSLHVKKGDRVKVIAGNDKGKIGEIISVDPRAQKVIVEGESPDAAVAWGQKEMEAAAG